MHIEYVVQTYTLELYQTDKMLYKLFVIEALSKEWTSYKDVYILPSSRNSSSW
jgi:hypothetical protein